MQKIVQRYGEKGRVSFKVKSRKREKRRKQEPSRGTQMRRPQRTQGLQAVSPTDCEETSISLPGQPSFPTSFQPIFLTLQVSGCHPTSSKGPCFSSLKSSYLFTQHGPWLWHSGQSPEETVQQPETQKDPCPKSRSPEFSPLSSPLHSHPEDLAQSPTQDKHPPSPCLQVFKED